MLAGALGGALAVEAMVDAEVVGIGVVVAGAGGAVSAPLKAGVGFRGHPVEVELVLAALAVVVVVLAAEDIVIVAAFSRMYSLSSTIR